jgi:hypothetical protein
MVRAELEHRLQESRRLASALDSDLDVRRAQGACRELEFLIHGLEHAVSERLTPTPTA